VSSTVEDKEKQLTKQLAPDIWKDANIFQITCDADFRILNLNRYLLNYFPDLQLKELRQDVFASFGIPEAEAEQVRHELGQTGRISNAALDLRYGQRHILCLWNIHRTESDGSIYYNFFGSDITERRKVEMQLAQSQKLSALGQMAGGIAHDLSKPVNAIVSLIQVMEAHTDDPFLLDKLDLITRQMDFLNNTVRQLVNLGRPMSAEVEAVNINKVLMEAQRIVKYDVSLRDVAIQTYYCPVMRRISLSYDRLLQVFINLLLNAGEAVKDVSDPAIVISTECRQTEIYIEIQDNGRGIPADQLDRVFDPFFTTKTSSEGSGLGLWMCHHIITEIGGRIWIESVPGKGTLVNMILPLMAEGDSDAS